MTIVSHCPDESTCREKAFTLCERGCYIADCKHHLMTFFEAWEKAEDGDILKIVIPTGTGREFIKNPDKPIKDTGGDTMNSGFFFKKTWEIIPKKKEIKTVEFTQSLLEKERPFNSAGGVTVRLKEFPDANSIVGKKIKKITIEYEE